jgi:mRNA interferase MazF
VLAGSGRGDWICVQITSNPYADPKAIELTSKDFTDGGLIRVSYIRPGKLFTANETLFRRCVANVSKQKFQAIVGAVISLLRNDG